MLALLVALVAAATSASTAKADIVGAGPDETIQQAYPPLAQSVNYNGAFTDSADVDYLAFRVATAGESLHFTVSNTLKSCNSPDQDSCPLYATLMDQTNHQVGGDTSSAGTVATVNDTETIDWTFAEPGTYYLLMESNGNLPAGQPTYTVRIGPPPSTGPVVKSVNVPRHQHGNDVKATVVFAQPAASLRATLFGPGRAGHQPSIASVTRHPVSARTYVLNLRLSGVYRRMLKVRHKLSLVVKIGIAAASERSLRYVRRVTLTS